MGFICYFLYFLAFVTTISLILTFLSSSPFIEFNPNYFLIIIWIYSYSLKVVENTLGFQQEWIISFMSAFRMLLCVVVKNELSLCSRTNFAASTPNSEQPPLPTLLGSKIFYLLQRLFLLLLSLFIFTITLEPYLQLISFLYNPFFSSLLRSAPEHNHQSA